MKSLNFGCLLPDHANNCLHKSSTANFRPFAVYEKVLSEKIRQDMTDGLCIAFTWKAVVDQTFIRVSTRWLKINVGIDACQLLP